jgi:hypothetical protein
LETAGSSHRHGSDAGGLSQIVVGIIAGGETFVNRFGRHSVDGPGAVVR